MNWFIRFCLKLIFSPEDYECFIMKNELVELKTQKFAELCARRLDICRAEIDNCKPNALVSILGKSNAENERLYNIAQRENEEIRSMSNGEIRQLYHATFGRWHPIGLEKH